MAEVYSNLAESTVLSVSGGGSINNTTDPVTFNVQVGDGAKFPAAATGGPDFFTAVLDTGTSAEIVHCQRTGDQITATRAQEGTAKVAHSLGTRFAHVVTAGSLTQIPAYQQGSTLTTKGDLYVTRSTAVATAPRRHERPSPHLGLDGRSWHSLGDGIRCGAHRLGRCIDLRARRRDESASRYPERDQRARREVGSPVVPSR
jgi:hypothetical protein